MPKQNITLGLSVHRPEMIPIIANRMWSHEAIFLEEPPTEGFEQMLAGELAVDEYLRKIDVEYPAFSKDMCSLLRKLKADGKQIHQVEPFLEILLDIHIFFAEGNRPEQIDRKSAHFPVYLAERKATKALMAYYQTAMTGSFEETIAAVIEFARMDAARFRLRDSLRAQELAPLISSYGSSYIEAGLIHYRLWQLLQQKVGLKLAFLADDVLEKVGESGRLYEPGDQLTLLYIFHPNIATTTRERMLAARSIILSKIIEKEECKDNMDTFPHLRDELACIRITRQLGFDDCRRLFPLIRRVKSFDARKIVTEYLAESASIYSDEI